MTPGAFFVSIRSRGLIAQNGLVAQAPPRVIRILLLLLCAQGRSITKDEFVDLLFGDDPTGGPESADVVVHTLLAEAKIIAAALGVSIFAIGNRGYSARPIQRVAA